MAGVYLPIELPQDYPARSIAAAQVAIAGHTELMGLEEGNGAGTDLWHLIHALLEWSDARGVDFDEILGSVRDHNAEEEARARSAGS